MSCSKSVTSSGVRVRRVWPAARRTAQLAFERVLFEHGEEQVTTGDVLRAAGQTRRTLTPELVTDFEQDIQNYARV
jgi:hypothetical protein